MTRTVSQDGKPEEKKKEARPGLTDNYTPAANVLIQGFSELSISERYVAIGLVSLYWDEKVYPVSLRELAAKIQINHTTLRSRGGKRPAEGILDKLWRLGIIGLLEGKPLTDIGNKGRVQTYLRVNHRFIAERNQDCTQGKKAKTPRYTVGTTNSSTDEATVGNDNHTVGDTNDTVGNTNHTVVHVSVELPHKNNKNSKNLEDSFSTPENVSCSQTLSQPPPEKKDDALLAAQQRIAELEQQLASSQADSSRLQENKAHQSTEQPSSQEKKPDFLAGLNDMSVRQPTPAEQKRIDAAAQRARDKQIKSRQEEIWLYYGKLTGSTAIRDLWSEKAVKALAEGDATDEKIQKTFAWLQGKNMSTTLSYIAANLNSCNTTTTQQTTHTTPGRKAVEDRKALEEKFKNQPFEGRKKQVAL